MSEKRSNFQELLEEICLEQGILLENFSDNWGHRLTKEGKSAYIVGYQFGLNLSSVKEICQDKVLTFEILSQAGIPACEHIFLPVNLSPEEAEKTGAKMLEKYGKAVLKDNYGTGGFKVFLINDMAEFKEKLSEIHKASYAAALCPFIDIIEEYRVILLDGEPLLTIRKDRPYETYDGRRYYTTWKHNLSQGARGTIMDEGEILPGLHELAKRTAGVIPVRFASIDIIETAEGLKILEINGGVMMEHLAGQSPRCRKRAKEAYEKAVLRMFED